MTGFLRFARKEEITVASEIKKRFTDTEMQIARETDLPELLTHLGYQVKRIGRYHTTAEMDSLRIKDRRTWFRYSQNTGGDAITLVQQFCDKTFPEAVEYLLTFNGRARDSPAKAVPSVKRDEVQKPFTLPPRNTDDRRVFAYLRKRGIAAQVIRQFNPQNRIHLTEKPLQLMKDIVKITEAGGHILDPFAGSGTTVLAAVLEGYSATGIEMSDVYAELARERIKTELEKAA